MSKRIIGVTVGTPINPEKLKEKLKIQTEINTALAQAKASGEFKGDKGATGAAGKDGTSVTVKSVSESSADGGSNVVTFSDGKTVTIKNGKTGATGATGATGPQGPAGKDGVTGAKGDTGQRGTGLLPVTTAPSSYTTAVNGLTPAYRIALSTVKSQASATEVYAGDTVRYSYYHYPVIYVDSSYVYCGVRVSIRGSTGAAGPAGADGKTAYRYAQDGGYTGTVEEFAQKLAAESYGYVAQPEPPEDTKLLWIDTDEESEDSGSAPADWNAAEGEPGHVWNRTHYSEYKDVTLLDNVTVAMEEVIHPFALIEGQSYTIAYNGVEYTEVCKFADLGGMACLWLGNGMIVGSSDINPDHPYSVVYLDISGGCMIAPMFDDEAVMSISTYQEVVHKLPDKYVNIPDYRPFYVEVLKDSEGYYTTLGVTVLEQAYNSGRQIALRLTQNLTASTTVFYLFYFVARVEMKDEGIVQYAFYSTELNAGIALNPNGTGGYDVTYTER